VVLHTWHTYPSCLLYAPAQPQQLLLPTAPTTQAAPLKRVLVRLCTRHDSNAPAAAAAAAVAACCCSLQQLPPQLLPS
jgi:hypothetical protein